MCFNHKAAFSPGHKGKPCYLQSYAQLGHGQGQGGFTTIRTGEIIIPGLYSLLVFAFLLF